MVRVLMVEDEAGAATVFQNLLALHAEDFQFLGVAKNVKEAVARIKETKPDVVVLDISLPDGTGFDVLETLGEISFEVIFLTAHENYALQAIKNKAFDYILKPLQSKEMHDVLRNVKLKCEEKNKGAKLNKLALNTVEGIEFINIEEIKYLQASSNYTEIITVNEETILASKTLKSFEELLEDPFCRVHKSYVINTKLIKKYDKSDSVIHLNCGKAIPVSKTKKDDFLALIEKWV